MSDTKDAARASLLEEYQLKSSPSPVQQMPPVQEQEQEQLPIQEAQQQPAPAVPAVEQAAGSPQKPMGAAGVNSVSTAFNGIELLAIAGATVCALVIGISSLSNFSKMKKAFAGQDKKIDSDRCNLMLKDLAEVKITAFYAQPGKPGNEPLGIYGTQRTMKLLMGLLNIYVVMVAIHFALPLMYSLLLLANQDEFAKAEPLFTKNNAPNIKVQISLLFAALLLFVFNKFFYSAKFATDFKSRDDMQNLGKLQSRFSFIQGQYNAILAELNANISTNTAYTRALVNYLTMGEDDLYFKALQMEKNTVERVKCIVTYSLLRTYRSQMPHYRPEEYDFLEAAFREGLAKKEINLLSYFMVNSPVIGDATEELLNDLMDYKRKTSPTEVTSAFASAEEDAFLRTTASNYIQNFNKQMSKLVAVDYPAIRKPLQSYLLTMGLVNTLLALAGVGGAAVAAGIPLWRTSLSRVK